jgi:hypothetical protein
MKKIVLLMALALAGCRDNGTGGPDMSASPDMAGLTTIAAARMGNVTTTITVVGVVIAVNGTSAKEWYIQDAAGGAFSGVDVFCNKTAHTNPCPMAIVTPSLHDLVQVTGKLSTYKGKLELQPSAQSTVMANAAPPAPMTVTAADVASNSTNAAIRGSIVKLTGTFTVDSTAPATLYDTNCAGDAGVNGYCSGCRPPTYSGFQVNDGAGHSILVQQTFYTTNHLASSMECLTQSGAIPVMTGRTLSALGGIVDVDPFGVTPSTVTVQPTADSDYTLQ